MTRGVNSLRGTIPRENPYDSRFPAIDLNPAKFNALANQYGVKILHEKASICPNFQGPISSQQHDPNCTICEGSFVYYDPRTFVGFFSTNEMVRNYLRGGFWENGSAMLTTPSYYDQDPNKEDDQVYISFFDKMTLVDFEDRFYELIHKSEDSVDKLRYKAIKILFVRTKNKEYLPERHFVLNENGDINWVSEDRPGKDMINNLGEPISVSYLYRPVYKVVTMLHEGRFSQVSFRRTNRLPTRYPQQCMIKKDFLITKKDAQGNIVPDLILP